MPLNHPLGHLKVTAASLDEMVQSVSEDIRAGGKSYCVPINVTKYSMAKSDEKLRRTINDAKYVTADGLPIVWLSRRAGKPNVRRVTGVDLAEALIARAAKERWRLFFFGTGEDTVQRAIANLQDRHGPLEIAGHRNGFFAPGDVPEVVQQISDARPDILFLGLGLPQKEYFVHDHFAAIDTRFCITVGGAIDIWAKTKKRAPRLVQSIGMEWLYRSLSNPRKSTTLIVHARHFAADMLIYRRSIEAPR